MIAIIFSYTLVVGGMTLPTLSIEMVSPEACVAAQNIFFSSSLVQSIQANGGSVTTTCRAETR